MPSYWAGRLWPLDRAGSTRPLRWSVRQFEGRHPLRDVRERAKATSRHHGAQGAPTGDVGRRPPVGASNGMPEGLTLRGRPHLRTAIRKRAAGRTPRRRLQGKGDRHAGHLRSHSARRNTDGLPAARRRRSGEFPIFTSRASKVPVAAPGLLVDRKVADQAMT
jgi:hypothetical protein